MKKIAIIASIIVAMATKGYSQAEKTPSTLKIINVNGKKTVSGIPKDFSMQYFVMERATVTYYVVLESLNPKEGQADEKNFLLYVGKYTETLFKKEIVSVEKDGGTTVIKYDGITLTFPTFLCVNCRPEITRPVTTELEKIPQ